MKRHLPFAPFVLLALACSAFTLPAQAEDAKAPVPSRGELLYENHCGVCHGMQMHWREQRVAKDWASLKMLVRRWQGAAQLNWSDDEVDDVARYLNARFYRFEGKAPPA